MCRLSRTLPLGLIVLLWAPSQTSAAPVVITHGSTIKHLGDITDPRVIEAHRQGGFPTGSVGFYYSYFGIFWVDFWTWEGSFCVYQGKQASKISAEQAAQFLNKPVNEMKPPFWYTYPPGLVVLGGIVLVSVPFTIRAKARTRRIKALLADERYRAALDLIGQPQVRYAEAMTRWHEVARLAAEAHEAEPPHPPPPSPDAGYEEAIQSLVREGIPREEAESNLNAMLAHITEQQALASGTA